ncbi:hypothetical protein LFM09_17745 [Lentzea alba]|uniref:hypothetical protein n=1 Tax=Lentzea alba TaxID=2714351 RepID=UPI0039BF107C
MHQHLDIGQGEVDRVAAVDDIATVYVFGWEERAVDSSRFVLGRVMKELHRS